MSSLLMAMHLPAVVMLRIVPIVRTLVLLVVIFIVISLILRIVRKELLGRSRDQEQRARIVVLFRIVRYTLILALIVVGILSYTGSWTGLGVSLGLLSAGIGFALQKPLVSVAAWVMVLFKRPFHIGDRVAVGTVRGDVIDITLTHLYLREVGRYGQEDVSGRTVILPNAMLFDVPLINYRFNGDAVLGQVVTDITYESDLDAATELILTAARGALANVPHASNEPYVRYAFAASSITITLRYYAPTAALQRLASDITYAINASIRGADTVAIAYPRTDVALVGGSAGTPLAR